MTRKNLALDPSFNVINGFWQPVNSATVSGSSAFAFYGPQSLRVVKSATNGSGFRSVTPIPVVAGSSYAASVYIRVPITLPVSETATITLRVVWLNAAGAQIGESLSSASAVEPEDAWTRVTLIATAPVLSISAQLEVQQLSIGSAGQIFFADAFLFEQAQFVGGYLDNISQATENKVVNRALTLPSLNIKGLDLKADIMLGDLVLNTIDESNNVWVCTDIDGWWGQADAELPNIARGAEDGSYDVSGRFQSRELVLSGVFFPSTVAELGRTRDKLVSATNLLRRGAWLRTNEEPTKAAYVRLSGRPSITTVNARGRTEFSVPLRAVDPIKYEWNDQDSDGFSIVSSTAGSDELSPNNIGTADVAPRYRLTGPLGVGSTIYNSATDQTITTTVSLRGAGTVAEVTGASLSAGVATLSLEAASELVAGDVISVAGVGAPYDSVGSTYVVVSVSNSLPFSVSHSLPFGNRPFQVTSGQILLASNDVLELDSYNKSVTINGNAFGHRAKISTLSDWIKLAPGVNIFQFTNKLDIFDVDLKKNVDGLNTIRTRTSHLLQPGENITVALPVSAPLLRRSRTSNVVTLTTAERHGFSTGDLIAVEAVEISTVTAKEVISNEVTLTTAVDGGFVVGDSILVTLPTTASIVRKQVIDNVVQLTSTTAHGYSPGDSVSVVLPQSASITQKSSSNNVATITTQNAHNFSIGDRVAVTLPTSATVTSKAISGSSATLVTSASHGFSLGDRVVVAFPAVSTISGTRSFAGASTNLVSLTTSAPHGFTFGDRIVVNVGIPSTVAITTAVATTTSATLTATNHRFAVGEVVTVSGLVARYNGTFTISGVTANTFTYTLPDGSAVSSAAVTGSVVNVTVQAGYNGAKIVNDVTSTTLTYFYYGQSVATSSTQLGATPTITNTTNQELNGTVIITSTPTTQQFSYTRTVI
jgi:hypothetical protein